MHDVSNSLLTNVVQGVSVHLQLRLYTSSSNSNITTPTRYTCSLLSQNVQLGAGPKCNLFN